MRGSIYSLFGSLNQYLAVLHSMRLGRIRDIGKRNSSRSRFQRNNIWVKRRNIGLALVILTLFSIFRTKTPIQIDAIYRTLRIDSIKRLLSACYPNYLSYVSLEQISALRAIIMSLPITRRQRDVPTHIILCNEFIRRREVVRTGGTLSTQFSLTEDESVCTDWAAPHASLMEIMASTVVGHTAAPYRITYRHNCGAADDNEQMIVDGTDWTTIQQSFPLSSLVLDNGSINEEEIAQLCTGCINNFSPSSNDGRDAVNPPWYDPEETHHCILDPRTTKNINDDGRMDLGANAKQRNEAPQLVIGRVLQSVQDRLLLAAVEQKMEGEVNEGTRSFVSGEEGSRSFVSGLDDGALPDSTPKEYNDAIIYMEEGSLPMTGVQYQKHIPSFVQNIAIFLHPLCATSDQCRSHAEKVQSYLTDRYTAGTVSLAVVTSTAEAYSKMVLSRYLICSPGTTGCLIPAMSKKDGTVAVMGESPHRPNTFQYFDFVSGYGNQLQVATVDFSAVSGYDSEIDDSEIENDDGLAEEELHNERAKDTSILDNQIISLDEIFGRSGFRDGCLETRGNMGSWEQDFSYDSLLNEEAANLRGSSVQGVISNRYAKGNSMFHDVHLKKAADVEDHKALQVQQLRAIEKEDDTPMSVWTEENEDCNLDILNLVGLCQIMAVMKLSVIQFVGDEYTRDMVISFWKLLGLPDADNPGLEPNTGNGLPSYRKTVTCFAHDDNKDNYLFDVVFTPNENLVTDDTPEPVPDVSPATPYVPPIAPYVPPVNRNFGEYQTLEPTWFNDPYGMYGMQSGQSLMLNEQRSIGAGLPTQSNYCECVPFMQQYQSNIMYSEPMPPAQPLNQNQRTFIANPQNQGTQYTNVPIQPPHVNRYNEVQLPQIPDQNRQIIMAGLNPNLSYEQWCQQYNTFGQQVGQYVNPNDIVVMRSAIAPHGSCGCQRCGGFRRRTEEAGNTTRALKEGEHSMTLEEIELANKYMIESINEYRRRTKQHDLLAYSPHISGKAQIHFLDVSHMTHSHPHAKASTGDSDHGRKLCQAQGLDTAPMVDSWNHMFYSNMKEMARGQVAAGAAPQVWNKNAPPGSPYSYAYAASPNYQPMYP